MIDRLRHSLRERGARGTLAQVGRSMRRGYEHQEVLVVVKELDQIVEPRSVHGMRIEDLTADHMDGLRALNRKRNEPEADGYFENSLRYGFHGFAAIIDDELVGYYWWVDRHNPVPHPDLWRLGRGFALESGDVYGCSLFLLAEQRGGGRAEEFLFGVESALRERGYKRIWGYIDKGNRAARWLYGVRGYRPTWKVQIRRFAFLGWRSSTSVSDGA